MKSQPEPTTKALCFKHWPKAREQRARVIGEWLRTEARFLAAD
jgi:hypothetical protein